MAEPELPASALVDAIDEALVVVDSDDTIVEYNDTFQQRLGAAGEDLTGPIAEALSETPALRDGLVARTNDTVAVEGDDETRYFELSFSPIENGTDGGYELVVLRDVTSQRQRREALERENEQLDQFASFISHDLRNPLDVAMGRTTVIGELTDDPQVQDHVEEVERAHERMLRIIDDVLTLARQGQSIDEKTEVDVGALASDAWSHVETGAATLDVETRQAVLADPERLGQVFENLFRNSLEHGQTAESKLAVTVGPLDEADGFFVSDNGVGIDPDIRDRVMEAGFTAEDEGTGLGLGIVSNIAQAHDWDVNVAESESGGARFEFSGVAIVGDDD